LASLPHVAQLSAELGSFGLVVVGAHSQEAAPEKVKAVATSRGVAFTNVQFVNLEGDNGSKGIPHVIVFDHTGKCVYRGSPDGAEVKMRIALGKALAAKFEGTPTKAITGLLENLKKGLAPTGVLQKALSMTKSSEKETSEQAKELVSKMTEHADKDVSQIENQRSTNPVGAYLRAAKISTDLKGTPAGNKAAEIAAELKKDKTVIADAKARPMLELIQATDDALRDVLGKEDPKGKEFQKAQASILKQMQTAIKKMKASYPDAPSTKEALDIAEKYGLSVK
jgi:hypothetical protein